MAEPLSSTFVTEKNKLHSASGWIRLFELVVNSTTSIRIADDHANFTWNGKVYYAAALEVSEIISSNDGSLEGISVICSNVSQELTALIESNTLIDKNCWTRDVHRTSGALADVVENKFQVKAIDIRLETITFTAGHMNLLGKPCPGRTFERDWCPVVFKGADCGYIGSLLSCDHTLNGSNGCKAKGADEVANGLPKIHPKRFGAFAGLPQAHA